MRPTFWRALIGVGSPPINYPSISSHFNLGKGHVSHKKSSDQKTATSNIISLNQTNLKQQSPLKKKKTTASPQPNLKNNLPLKKTHRPTPTWLLISSCMRTSSESLTIKSNSRSFSNLWFEQPLKLLPLLCQILKPHNCNFFFFSLLCI